MTSRKKIKPTAPSRILTEYQKMTTDLRQKSKCPPTVLEVMEKSKKASIQSLVQLIPKKNISQGKK